MEVPTLAAAVVDRIAAQQERMRGLMLWQVTDVLLRYEKILGEARAAIEEADMALLVRGVKRDDPTRRRLAGILSDLR